LSKPPEIPLTTTIAPAAVSQDQYHLGISLIPVAGPAMILFCQKAWKHRIESSDKKPWLDESESPRSTGKLRVAM
jgi:hypothetical protein